MATPLFCVYLGLDFDITERMPSTNYWRPFPLRPARRTTTSSPPGSSTPDPPVYITSASAKDPGHEGHAPARLFDRRADDLGDARPRSLGNQPRTRSRKYSRQASYLAAKDKIIEQLIDRAEDQSG